MRIKVIGGAVHTAAIMSNKSSRRQDCRAMDFSWVFSFRLCLYFVIERIALSKRGMLLYHGSIFIGMRYSKVFKLSAPENVFAVVITLTSRNYDDHVTIFLLFFFLS